MESNRVRLFICLLLIVGIFLSFGSLTECDFISLDDASYIYNNPAINLGLSPDGLKWAFTTNLGGYWMPITWLSFLVDSQLYGLNPGGYHFTNILLHMANAILLFLFLSRITGSVWKSAFVSALFAIHPVQVESVAWVTERKDVLSALFWILTLHAYALYVKSRDGGWYGAVFILFALGLMVKPMIVTLPCAMLLFDYWPLNRVNRDDRLKSAAGLVLEKIPLFILAGIFSYITYSAQNAGGSVISLDKLSLVGRIGLAGAAYLAYLSHAVWPAGLCVFYPYPVELILVKAAAGWTIILSVTTAAALFREKKYFITGWLFFLGILFPVSGIMQSGSQAMADRFTYIPIVGLFIAAVWGLSDFASGWRHGKAVLAVLGATIVCAYGAAASNQAGFWKNSETAYKRALENTSNNWFIHELLGIDLYHQGRMEEAEAQLLKSLKIKQTNPQAYEFLGYIYFKRGENDKALQHYRMALSLDPKRFFCHYNAGLLLLSDKHFEEAVLQFKKALDIQPQNAAAVNYLALAYGSWEKYALADKYYRKALALNPANPLTRYYYALNLEKQGDYKEALEQLTTVADSLPENKDVRESQARIIKILDAAGQAH